MSTVTRVDTYLERVERGATFLDEHRPGWEDKIDTTELYLTDPCLCVLGQVEDDYYRGLQNLGISTGIPSGYDGNGIFRNDEAHDLGFFENSLIEHDCDKGRDIRWLDLQQTWINFITERRGDA